MAIYELLSNGVVLNTVVATEEFMEEHYTPSEYRLVATAVPTRRTTFTKYEVLRSFPADSLVAILQAVKTSPQMEAWYVKFNQAQEISATDPEWLEGVAALKQLGMLPADYVLE